MRKKTDNMVRTAASWIQRFLEVRLPMDVAAGLRTPSADRDNVPKYL